MKQCKKCGETKPFAEYYKHPKMGDGYLSFCKECVKERVRQYREKNIEKVRAYDRARGNRQTPEYFKEHRRKFPKKYRATSMVNNAIRDGKLFSEPCVICDRAKAHAHHDDYAKPLNVRWLCAACHQQWHARNGEGANSF